jgi:hypothetical protein
MNFEVYAYWNIEELAATFNAVAALMGSGDYLGLLRTLALVGILSLALVVLAGKGRMEEFWKWVIMLAVFNGMLLVPKTNVIVVDRTGSAPSQVVANVPIGLAAFAHSTSKIGDWLTGAFETVFSLPNDLQFRTSGSLFGHRVLQERLAIKSGQPILTSNFYEFYRECITPELASGYIRMNDLMKTNDIWGALSGMTNPSRLVSIRDTTDPSLIQTMGCNAGYTAIAAQLNAETAIQLGMLGNRMYPGMSSALANTAIAGSLATSTSYLLGLSATATDTIRQSIVSNAVIDAQYTIPTQIGDAASAATNLAQAQAVRQTSDSYKAMAKLAEGTMPKVRNAIELVQYAVFPIILILTLIAGHHGGTVLKMYAGSLIWIQLWPPLYAIMNFLMNVQAQKALTSATNGGGMSLEAYGYLNNSVVSDQAIAGMLVLSIPAIAAALIKWGDAGLRSVGSSFAPRDAEKAAASLAQGNMNMGNASLGNVQQGNYSALQHSTQPSLSTGAAKMAMADTAGSIERSGDAMTVKSGNMSMTGFDSNRDGRFTIDEVTNVSAAGSSLMGAIAQSGLGRSASDVQYSGEGTQASTGKASALGDTKTAKLTQDQSAVFQRQLSKALNSEIGGDTSAGVTSGAGNATSTGRDFSAKKGLTNHEGSSMDSVLTAGGSGTQAKPAEGQASKDPGRAGQLAMALAEKASGVSARVAGGVKTGQRYDESADQTLKTATQDELRQAAEVAKRGLLRVAGSTSDQGVKQAAERAAAALDKAKSFDSKELASLTEQQEAGSRRQAGNENRSNVSVDESLIMAKSGYEMLFGKGSEVTPERLAAFQREWNSNQGFREDVALETRDRLAKSRLAAEGIEPPKSQDAVRGEGQTALDALDSKGNDAVASQGRANSGHVERQQYQNPRSMPDLSPAAKTYAESFNAASDQVKRKESKVSLESGITVMANQLYQERQRGTGTVLLNTYGFGAGSASVQDYAGKLREAAQKDPELAQGLATIGSNNRAGVQPSNADMAWLEGKAKQSVRQAEGSASEGAGWIADQAGKGLDLFSPNSSQSPTK